MSPILTPDLTSRLRWTDAHDAEDGIDEAQHSRFGQRLKEFVELPGLVEFDGLLFERGSDGVEVVEVEQEVVRVYCLDTDWAQTSGVLLDTR